MPNLLQYLTCYLGPLHAATEEFPFYVPDPDFPYDFTIVTKGDPQRVPLHANGKWVFGGEGGADLSDISSSAEALCAAGKGALPLWFPARRGRATSTTAVVSLRMALRLSPPSSWSSELSYLKDLFRLSAYTDEAPQFLDSDRRAELGKMKVADIQKLGASNGVKWSSMRGQCDPAKSKAAKISRLIGEDSKYNDAAAKALTTDDELRHDYVTRVLKSWWMPKFDTASMEEGRKFERYVLDGIPGFFDNLADGPFEIISSQEVPLIQSKRMVQLNGNEYQSPASSTMDALQHAKTPNNHVFPLTTEVKTLSSQESQHLMRSFSRDMADPRCSGLTRSTTNNGRFAYVHLDLTRDAVERGERDIELKIFHKYVMGTYKVQVGMHSAVSGVKDGLFVVAMSDRRAAIANGGVQYVVHVTFDQPTLDAILKVVEDAFKAHLPWALTRDSDDIYAAFENFDFSNVPTLNDAEAVAGDFALADAILAEARERGGHIANCRQVKICTAQVHNIGKGGVDNTSASVKDIYPSLPQQMKVGTVLHIKTVLYYCINANNIHRAIELCKHGTGPDNFRSKDHFRQKFNNCIRDTLKCQVKRMLQMGELFRDKDEEYSRAVGGAGPPPVTTAPLIAAGSQTDHAPSRRTRLRKWLTCTPEGKATRCSGNHSIVRCPGSLRGACTVCGKREATFICVGCSLAGGIEEKDDGTKALRTPMFMCVRSGPREDFAPCEFGTRACTSAFHDPLMPATYPGSKAARQVVAARGGNKRRTIDPDPDAGGLETASPTQPSRRFSSEASSVDIAATVAATESTAAVAAHAPRQPLGLTQAAAGGSTRMKPVSAAGGTPPAKKRRRITALADLKAAAEFMVGSTALGIRDKRLSAPGVGATGSRRTRGRLR